MTPEPMQSLRSQVAAFVDDGLRILPALTVIMERNTLESEEDGKVVWAACSIALSVLSYAVHAGIGSEGILNAMAAHLAEKVRGQGGGE